MTFSTPGKQCSQGMQSSSVPGLGALGADRSCALRTCQHQLQPCVPMDPLCSSFHTRGRKPKAYLEKQRKSPAKGGWGGGREGNSLKCCLWGRELQLLEIPSLETQLQSSAAHHHHAVSHAPCCEQQDAATHSSNSDLWARGEASAAARPSSSIRPHPEIGLDGKGRKQRGGVRVLAR